MALDNIVRKAIDIYKNNRVVNINLNVVAGSIISFGFASGMSEFMAYQGQPDAVIATAAAITELVTYFPILVGLHYNANKEEFTNEEGIFNKKAFWKDVGKFYLTNAPVMGLFYVMAVPFHDFLMGKGFRPGVANQMAYWGTMVVTRSFHTLIGVYTGLFKKKQEVSLEEKTGQ
ncbi:MAG: hypothetical protein ABIB43_01915 [archaeon]